MPQPPSHHDGWEEKVVDRLAGDLGAAEAEALDDHLRGCARCAQVLQEYELLVNCLEALWRDGVPDWPLPPAMVALQREIACQYELERNPRHLE